VALLLSAGLLLVSAAPQSVSLLRDVLFLEREQFSRLIAVLIVSNLGLWLLLIYTRVRWSNQAIHFDYLVRSLGTSEFTRQHPEIERLPPVVVVIPAYEEENNIAAIIEAAPRQVCGLDLALLVVDDGSRDGTARAA